MQEKELLQIKNKVIISDPCYSRDNNWLTEQDNMLEGSYNYYIEKIEEGLGNRIKSIEIVHSGYKRPKRWKYKNSLVGVDSGQAGIFCGSIYPEGETGDYDDSDSFYGKCCELTMQNHEEVQNYERLVRDIEMTEKLKESGKGHDMVIWQRNYHKEYVEALESLDKYLAHEKKRCDETPYRNGKTWEDYIEHFTQDFYRLNECKWYHKRYELYDNYLTTKQLPERLKLISFGIIDNKGIVSRSGYGDGVYNCYANFNKQDKCIGIKIKFI